MHGNKNEHDEPITCLAIHPENNYIMTGSKDKVVKLWNTHK